MLHGKTVVVTGVPAGVPASGRAAEESVVVEEIGRPMPLGGFSRVEDVAESAVSQCSYRSRHDQGPDPYVNAATT